VTRWAQLWAGPMDGQAVFLGDGELPARVGMHRTADGALVPIRSRALLAGLPLAAGQVAVYERATVDVVRACRDATGVVHASWLEDGSTYVYREVVTRWLAASS
jgi:hypothetical protein